jgi:hypothetical protein
MADPRVVEHEHPEWANADLTQNIGHWTFHNEMILRWLLAEAYSFIFQAYYEGYSADTKDIILERALFKTDGGNG